MQYYVRIISASKTNPCHIIDVFPVLLPVSHIGGTIIKEIFNLTLNLTFLAGSSKGGRGGVYYTLAGKNLILLWWQHNLGAVWSFSGVLNTPIVHNGRTITSEPVCGFKAIFPIEDLIS